jgi:uncharacterized repeat protein (TIGR01451 family)
MPKSASEILPCFFFSSPTGRQICALIFSVLCLGNFAWAADLETKLTAERVSGTGAAEKFSDAAAAAPGDTIRYVVTFTNTTARVLREVAATLPIPQNLELVLASVQPAAREGSVDGKEFVALAKLLKPKSDGGWGVSPSAIRALRWAPRDVAATSALSVEARAKVSSTPAAQR